MAPGPNPAGLGPLTATAPSTLLRLGAVTYLYHPPPFRRRRTSTLPSAGVCPLTRRGWLRLPTTPDPAPPQPHHPTFNINTYVSYGTINNT